MKVALAVTLMALSPVVGVAQTTAPKPAATFVDTCTYDANAPRGVLEGTITGPDEAPVPGATVKLRCGSFTTEIRTGVKGTYRLTAAAGSFQVDIDAPGFQPWSETVDLKPSGTVTRNFKLELGHFSSIVTVTASRGFVAGSSTTATKMDAPLIEIPQSVSVVTEDQMAARDVQTVNEAIRYTAGVDVDTYGTEPRYDWINIRGFDQSTYGLYRDNSRWQSGQVSGQIDPYLLQEVDVVKGPSSVLYGQNQPGGLVNLVTKRPPANPLRELVVSYGSFNRKQVQTDVGGPLDSEGHWLYRFTGLYRKSDTQVDYVPDDRWLVAPALTWKPSSDTTLTLLADYQHDNTGWSQFLPSQGTFVNNPNGRIPRHTFTGEPGYDFFHRNQWSVGSLFEHRFSSAWTLRNTLRYSSIEYDGKDVFGGGLQEDLRTLNRFAFGNALDLHLLTTDTNAYLHVRSGNIDHSILFGVDYSTSTSTIVSGFAAAPPIDIYHPVYGAPIPALFTYYDTRQPVDLLGLYVQDHMKIGERVVATVAGRHDWAKITTDDRIGDTHIEQKPSQFTGRVGLSYLTDAGFAPYVSYSTSFLPVAGVNFYGAPFDPTEGKQIEGGVKFQPPNSDSFVTASVFQINQTNVSVPDPENPLNTLQAGEIRSRGFELEAVGSLAEGFNFLGSYSYLDQKITKDTDPTLIGNRPPLAPDQLFSASLDYTVTRGTVAGLGLGLGVRYVGSRAGDNANTIEVPSYTLVDASARYMWRDVEFQLSATNLLDKTYVAVCTSPSYCNYGFARRILATVRYHWQAR